MKKLHLTIATEDYDHFRDFRTGVVQAEWAHTAAVYMRGWLNDEHGVRLQDIHWVQAGTNEPGRTEKVEVSLPKGVKLARVEDRSLSDMLAKGEIDCALVARPPDCFVA